MTENQNEKPQFPNNNANPTMPQDTEFAEEQNFSANPTQTVNNQPEQKSQDAMETKERGGNHNPQGANQYTSGRVDDRGRKEDGNDREEKKRGANQYTSGRNDDRGRKE